MYIFEVAQTFLEWYEELDSALRQRGMKGSEFIEEDLRREFNKGAVPKDLAESLAPGAKPTPALSAQHQSEVKQVSPTISLVVCAGILSAILFGTGIIRFGENPSTTPPLGLSTDQDPSLPQSSPVAVSCESALFSSSIGRDEAIEGQTFVVLFVQVENTSGESVHVNPNDFTLADSSGNTVSYDSNTHALDGPLDAVDLSPGQRTSGWLAFQTLKDNRYKLTRRETLGATSTVEISPKERDNSK